MWRPLVFFSKKLRPCTVPSSVNYLFCVSLSVMLPTISSRNVCVLTENQPITFAIQSRHERHSPRESRYLEYISQFTTDIRHLHGVGNHTVDALSWVEINASSLLSQVNFEGMSGTLRTENTYLTSWQHHQNNSIFIYQATLDA